MNDKKSVGISLVIAGSLSSLVVLCLIVGKIAAPPPGVTAAIFEGLNSMIIFGVLLWRNMPIRKIIGLFIAIGVPLSFFITLGIVTNLLLYVFGVLVVAALLFGSTVLGLYLFDSKPKDKTQTKERV